jgi:S-adenosylmethionine synthetase
MRNIVVEFPNLLPVAKQDVELVERKGIGHPDSICDGIAESVSRALSREYIKRYGRVLHHNTDQVELVGGGAEPKYGGGEFNRPIYILLSGRAATYIDKDIFPSGEIAIKAAKDYLKNNFRYLEVEKHVVIEQKIGQGSADLMHVFNEKEGIPKSNDTSFGVGFAPFSETEKLVLDTEKYITGDLRKKMKETGEDVKVMGFRKKNKITLTVACAMVSKYIKNIDEYSAVIEELKERIKDNAAKITDKEIELYVNTADNYEKDSVYLTVTGLSSEGGDDGSVGRGNRSNGLITPYRPMSLEATAGKNPINHVGKLYNLLSNQISSDIANQTGAEQVYVRILSQIGRPIDDPLVASLEIIGDKKKEAAARKITDEWLARLPEITEMCVEGKVNTF